MEAKIVLSLSVPGADLLTPEFCEKNPKKSYNEHKVLLNYTEGKGRNKKNVKKLLTIKTRKQKLVTQNINMNEEAYNYMLSTPTSPKFLKTIKEKKGRTSTIWNTFSDDIKLKKHFDLIASDLGAVSYTYEIL